MGYHVRLILVGRCLFRGDLGSSIRGILSTTTWKRSGKTESGKAMSKSDSSVDPSLQLPGEIIFHFSCSDLGGSMGGGEDQIDPESSQESIRFHMGNFFFFRLFLVWLSTM